MASKVVLTGASVQGRDHGVVGKNNQDSFVFGQQVEAFWGIVADGCGEGSRSEAGAHLVTAFAHRSLLNVANYSGLSPHQVVKNLMGHIVEFQEDLLRWFTNNSNNPETRLKFAFEHLLCTMVGFFVRGDEGVLFWAGDGAYLLGFSEPIEITADNQPKYLAYNALRSEAPLFESVPFNMSEVRRIAVATDGFDMTLFNEAFDKATSNALKRFLNMQKTHGNFHDDATLVTAQLIEEV
jgi:serine/threonine protein phosphatase PrpC